MPIAKSFDRAPTADVSPLAAHPCAVAGALALELGYPGSVRLASASVLCLSLVLACRAAPPPAPPPTVSSTDPDEMYPSHSAWEEPPEAGAAAPPASQGPMAVPTSCAPLDAAGGDGGAGSLCVPGDAFAKRLCDGSYPDVALVLMSKASPFTRMYLRGDVDAWNAEGGMSARARLSFDEEMLVLRRRSASTNSIVVGAGAGYQVMRWDGTCFTLEDGELTARRPPVAKHPPIPWRRLTDRTRDALLKNKAILAAFQRRGRECKGATTGEVSKACELADTALSAAVVAELRAGFALPPPDPLP